jgi:outer membrane protein assembly factor BamB
MQTRITAHLRLLLTGLALAGTTAALGAAPPESTAYQISVDHAGATSSGGALALQTTPLWNVTLPGLISYPLIAGDRVFVTVLPLPLAPPNTTALYALDAKTGATLWGPVPLVTGSDWSTATYEAGKLYVLTNDGTLGSFDAASGASGWSVSLGGSNFTAPPTVSNGVIYVSANGVLQAINAADGTASWSVGVSGGDTSSPAVGPAAIYAGYACPHVYGISLAGSQQWEYPAHSLCVGGGGATVAYSRASNRVFARDANAGYVLSAADGSLVSQFTSGRIPAVTATQAFVVYYGVLTALDPASGNVQWSFDADPQLSSAAIVIDNSVIVGSVTGMLYAFNADTGTLNWQVQTGSQINPPNEGGFSEPLTGLGVGDGILVVPANTSLIAYAILGPPAPTALTATGVAGAVQLSWTAPAQGSPTYNVYMGSASDTENITPVLTGISGTGATVSANLTMGTTYFFQVKAQSAAGISAPSSEASAAAHLPAVPANLAATAGVGSAQLSWSASPEAQSYNVYAGNAAGTPVKSGITTTSVTLTGLAPGTPVAYTVRAVAYDSVSASSNQVSVTPSAVAAPTGLVANGSWGTLGLSWQASPGATSYNVYLGTSPGGEAAQPVLTGITTTDATLTGLKDFTDYYLVVRALGPGGLSAPSAEVDTQLLEPGAPHQSGGGGGAYDWLSLAVLALLGLKPRRRTRILTDRPQAAASHSTTVSGGSMQRRSRDHTYWPLVLLALAGTTALGAATPPESTAYQITVDHSGVTRSGGALALQTTPLWKVSLPGAISYPLIAGGGVFVTVAKPNTQNGTLLYALDAKTGATLWGPVDLGGDTLWSALAYDAGKVFALNWDSTLSSYDAVSGAPGWSISLGSNFFGAPPTASNGVIYVSYNGFVTAISESTGATNWSQAVMGGDESSPSLGPNGVYVAYSCPNDYGFALDGTPQWHYFTSSCIGGGGKTVAYANGLLYTRDTLTSGYILNAGTGTLVGNFAGGTIPAVTATQVFYMQNALLHAVDLASNTERWSFAGDGQLWTAPVVIDNSVIVGSDAGMLFAVNADTGTVNWQVQTGSSVYGPDEQNFSQPLTGIGVGDGILVVPASTNLVAYAILGPPGPTALTATGVAGAVQLSWSAPAQGSPAYNLYMGSASDTENVTPVLTGISGTSATVSANLTMGTPYFFQVKAQSAAGISAPSNEASATAHAPAAPAGLSAVAEVGAAQLSWSASPEAQSYNVYAGTAAGTPLKSGITTTSVTLTGLTAGTPVAYTVRAVAYGTVSAASNEVSVTPQSLAAPTGVHVEPGVGELLVAWDASTGATSYNLYMGTSPGGENGQPVQSGISGTSASVSGLSDGVTYYFVVRAVGPSGTSPASAETYANTMQSGPPMNSGGGGGLDFLTLALLSLLALSAHQRVWRAPRAQGHLARGQDQLA